MFASVYESFDYKRRDIESLLACSQALYIRDEDLLQLDSRLSMIEAYLANIQNHLAQERAALAKASEFKLLLEQQSQLAERLCREGGIAFSDARPHELMAGPQPSPRRTVRRTASKLRTPLQPRNPPSSGQAPEGAAATKPVGCVRRAAAIAHKQQPSTSASSTNAGASSTTNAGTAVRPMPSRGRVQRPERATTSEEATTSEVPATPMKAAASSSGEGGSVEEEMGRAIECVTEEEMKGVPDYMKGRLDHHKVNELIEKFRSILKRKYSLLRMPPKKMSERQAADFQAYTAEETPLSKKQVWFSENDLRLAADIKNDNTLKCTMMILRHLGRMTRDNKRHIVVQRPN